MPLSLLNHSALALFAQRTRIPTSARSTGFCVIWVCINSSSSSLRKEPEYNTRRHIFIQTTVSAVEETNNTKPNVTDAGAAG